MRSSIDERFWQKVKKGTASECWEWQGATRRGYGRFWFQERLHGAHRVSFYLHNGRFPDNQACHRCDNPSCVNPGHLFDGTQPENMSDMIEKGRSGWQRHLDPAVIKGKHVRKTDKIMFRLEASERALYRAALAASQAKEPSLGQAEWIRRACLERAARDLGPGYVEALDAAPQDPIVPGE